MSLICFNPLSYLKDETIGLLKGGKLHGVEKSNSSYTGNVKTALERFTVKSPESHPAQSHVARNLSHVARYFRSGCT